MSACTSCISSPRTTASYNSVHRSNPKPLEAIALNMFDNLDAKLEMLSMAYARQPEIAPGIYDRVKSPNTSPVKPLQKISSEPAPQVEFIVCASSQLLLSF